MRDQLTCNNVPLPDPTPTNKEVWRLMEAEDRAIKELHSSLDSLNDHLSPVLNQRAEPIPESSGLSDAKGMDCLSILGTETNKLLVGIISATDFLNSIIDRLEI